MKPICSIFFHNYYGNHQYWIDFFISKLTIPSILYYNIVCDSIYNLQEEKEIKRLTQINSGNLHEIIFRRSPNKGKDIGGKLILLDAYKKLGKETEFGLFLHDKKSIYKANSIKWANGLFKIMEPPFQKKVFQLFTEHKNIGIIAASGSVLNEYNDSLKIFISTNDKILSLLQNQFNISPGNFQYVAGTMFWFRMQPLNHFFQKKSLLKIRGDLEVGNITDEFSGSYTHSWERLLSWIFIAQHYKINAF